MLLFYIDIVNNGEDKEEALYLVIISVSGITNSSLFIVNMDYISLELEVYSICC